jgi:hypothetical protein
MLFYSVNTVSVSLNNLIVVFVASFVVNLALFYTYRVSIKMSKTLDSIQSKVEDIGESLSSIDKSSDDDIEGFDKKYGDEGTVVVKGSKKDRKELENKDKD